MLSLAVCKLWLISDAGTIGRGGEPGEGKTKSTFGPQRPKVIYTLTCTHFRVSNNTRLFIQERRC